MLRTNLAILTCFIFSAFVLPAPPKSWTITLEEPTGIFRRDHEVITVKLKFNPGEARKERLRVIAPDGREIRSQV